MSLGTHSVFLVGNDYWLGVLSFFFGRECLLIDPKEHPMLLAEPSSNSQQQRERYFGYNLLSRINRAQFKSIICMIRFFNFCRTVELMFEKYKAPALFLAKNAVSPSLIYTFKNNICHGVRMKNYWWVLTCLDIQVLTSFASGRATSLVVDG